MQRLVRLNRRRRHCSGKIALLTADGADQASQSLTLEVALVELRLHAKNQPDLSINVVRAVILGFLALTLAPDLSKNPPPFHESAFVWHIDKVFLLSF